MPRTVSPAVPPPVSLPHPAAAARPQTCAQHYGYGYEILAHSGVEHSEISSNKFVTWCFCDLLPNSIQNSNLDQSADT